MFPVNLLFHKFENFRNFFCNLGKPKSVMFKAFEGFNPAFCEVLLPRSTCTFF